MQKVIRFQAVFLRVFGPAFVYVLLCGASLIFGTLLAVRADSSVYPLMRRAASGSVSIVCHLATQLLPFLIAAYAAYISRRWLLHTVCAVRLFSFTYIGALIWISFGSAGWLIRFLILFSDIILVPFLCWYGFRRAAGYDSDRRDFWICMGATVGTALINCLFISPLLVKII